jgi:hypothetical protein
MNQLKFLHKAKMMFKLLKNKNTVKKIKKTISEWQSINTNKVIWLPGKDYIED